MTGDSLPDADHVSRYCSPGRIADGLPSAAAFELRPQDQYLSVNWLEYWGLSDLGVALDRVRGEFDLRVNEKGRFAVLNVSEVKTTVEKVTQRRPSITHQPTATMESHAGVVGFFANDFEVAAELAEIVRAENVSQRLVAANDPSGFASLD